MSRIKCVIEECRRTCRRLPRYTENTQIICGRCWRTADARLQRRLNALKRRQRHAERLSRRKTINGKPRFQAQAAALDDLFGNALHAAWEAGRTDAQIKSAMRVEGTAGELAARRAAR